MISNKTKKWLVWLNSKFNYFQLENIKKIWIISKKVKRKKLIIVQFVYANLNRMK
jgi:hypothetical protein